MKCIKNTRTSKIKRVSDEEAQKLTKQNWKYVPKKEWKEAGRP